MGAPAPITVVARWRVKPGQLDDVLAHVAQLRSASLQEPGCLAYAAFRAVDAPDTVLLVERYADHAAVQAHRQSPHYAALLGERILPLLEERSVELLVPMEG